MLPRTNIYVHLASICESDASNVLLHPVVLSPVRPSRAAVKHDADSIEIIGNNGGWGGVTQIGCPLLDFHPYPNGSTNLAAPSSTSPSPTQRPTAGPSPTGGPACHSKPSHTNPNEPVSLDSVARIAGVLCNSKSYAAGSVFTQDSPHIVYDRAENGVSSTCEPSRNFTLMQLWDQLTLA